MLKKILHDIEKEAFENPKIGRKQCEGMIRAMDIIKKYIPENDGWTPVDPNNLPDPEVLCCDRYGEQLIGYLSNTEEGFICESNECIMYDVVAWMDKPKPYKKDGE